MGFCLDPAESNPSEFLQLLSSLLNENSAIFADGAWRATLEDYKLNVFLHQGLLQEQRDVQSNSLQVFNYWLEYTN